MKRVSSVKAVDDVDLNILEGETHSIVGESGSGKTTLGKTIAMIYRPTDGDIFFNGVNLTKLNRYNLKNLRRDIQVVFQEPTSSLNPKRNIKDILLDPLIIHKIGSKQERNKAVKEAIETVELHEDFLLRFPRMLSEGQKQRLGIARAIITNPKFIVLDEPTSSLDVSVQAKIIKLLLKLQKDRGFTYLFISHDLSLVKYFSHRVTVMYLGKVIEMAPTTELYSNPLNPYTIALLSSMLPVSEDEFKLIPEKIPLSGEIPSASNIPQGCVFHPRCYKAIEKCNHVVPKLIEIKKDHFVRCHLYE